jgi:hypothetical protein
MNTADEAIYAAIKEAQSLRRATKKKASIQVKGSERDIIRATVLSWFNNHRKQLTVVFSGPDLAEIDKRYQWVLQASHKGSLRSSYIGILKEIKDLLVVLRTSNVIKLSAAPQIVPTTDLPPDFAPIAQDMEMKAILEGRWVEITSCLAANAPLAATVMMGGLLEGLILARIERQTDKAVIYTAIAAPKDKLGQTLQLKEWTLQHYIGVAHELKWITPAVKDISDVIRDYRNYIHPKKQHSEKMSLSRDDATMLWEISKSIARQVLTIA